MHGEEPSVVMEALFQRFSIRSPEKKVESLICYDNVS